MAIIAYVLTCTGCGHTFDGPAVSETVDRIVKRPCPSCRQSLLRISGTKDDRVSWIILRCTGCGEETQIPHDQPHKVAEALKERCVCGGIRMPSDRR